MNLATARSLRWIASVVVASIASLLAGCSTKVHVSTIEVDLPADSRVDGLPFRVAERYELTLYKKDGGKYVKVKSDSPSRETLANPDRLYVLKLQGQPLSQGKVTVKMRADNTLETLNVSSTSKGQDILTELGAGMKKIADAGAARDKAAETEVSGDEDQRVTALQALHEAELAALALDSLPAGASAVDRRTAEQKLAKSRILANQKARRAGLPPPFPGAGD